VKEFCTSKYGVTFPMFSKIEVNGANAHPVYAFLKGSSVGGGEDISWNFVKFLVGRSGEVVNVYAGDVEPEELEDDIVAELAK